MNIKIIRILGFALLIGMALFPPWKLSFLTVGKEKRDHRPVGYYALWNPPTEDIAADESQTDLRYQVDLLRLGTQLAIVLLVMNGVIYFVRAKKA
jgi:hypothetical protein